MIGTVEKLIQIAQLARKHGVEELARQAEEVNERLSFDRVHMVVVGEFNRGKTTLVNALLGRSLLPMDIVPTTAAIWTIQKGKTTRAQLVMADGSKQVLETTMESFSRLSAEGTLARSGVRLVTVDVSELALGDDVVIVDTPGVNDINEQRAEITYSFLGQADAAIFLLDASSPVTKSEAQFLEGQVLSKSIERILFVLNKSDRIENDEVEDAVASARERLTELVGKPVRVIACDAARMLDGLTKGQLEAADHWGWSKLRSELDEMLREARSRVAREETAAKRACSLASHLESRVSARLQLVLMKRDELETAAREFEKTAQIANERLERFVSFCEVQGRDRLKTMLSKSLREKTDEFILGTETRLAALRGDFKTFAGKQLPYELQLLLKRWFETNQSTLEQYLVEFSGHVSREYIKQFGSAFGYVSKPTSPRAGANTGPGAPLVADDVNEYIGLALPAAGYLSLLFLSAGPFAIVGLVAGGIANKIMRDRHAEAVREQLFARLPLFVEESISTPFGTLLHSVDAWFEGLIGALRQQFEADLKHRQTDFDAARKDTASTTTDSLRKTQRVLVTLATP
jgi:small GTP-binding protein